MLSYEYEMRLARSPGWVGELVVGDHVHHWSIGFEAVHDSHY